MATVESIQSPTPAKREPFLRRWAPVWATLLVALVLQATAQVGLPSVDDALFAGSNDQDEWLDGGWMTGALALAAVGVALGMAYQALLCPSSQLDSFVFGALAVPLSSPTMMMLALLLPRDTDGYGGLLAIQLVIFAAPAMAAGGGGAALGGWAMRRLRRRNQGPPSNPPPVVSDEKP